MMRKQNKDPMRPTQPDPKPARTRIVTPHDELKIAERKLAKLEQARHAIVDSLSDEAAAMLEALDDLRARQPVAVPSSLSIETE